MLNISLKGFDAAAFKKAAYAAAEEAIAAKAKTAARPHGGVQVCFQRAPDGALRSVAFSGSDAAVAAAQAAVASQK
jgi:hypothetical protein